MTPAIVIIVVLAIDVVGTLLVVRELRRRRIARIREAPKMIDLNAERERRKGRLLP